MIIPSNCLPVWRNILQSSPAIRVLAHSLLKTALGTQTIQYREVHVSQVDVTKTKLFPDETDTASTQEVLVAQPLNDALLSLISLE